MKPQSSDQSTAILESDELSEASELKKFLTHRLKGQPKAIDTVCKIHEYGKIFGHLENLPGPLGVIMCSGPSGTGKTELARLLSIYFMGSEAGLVKFDCENFSQPHMIQSLIGAPHSYLGFDSLAMLSEEYIENKVHSSRESSTDLILLPSHKHSSNHSIKEVQEKLVNLSRNLSIKLQFLNYFKNFHDYLNKPTMGGSLTDSPDYNDKSSLSLLNKLSHDQNFREYLLSKVSKESAILLTENIEDRWINAVAVIECYTEITKLLTNYRHWESVLIELQKKNDTQEQDMEETYNDAMHGLEYAENDRDKPYLIMLFDEIEKASHTLWNLLLGIMESGKITLANGSETDFNRYNLLMILTSNVGENKIGELLKGKRIGFGTTKLSKEKTNSDEKGGVSLTEIEKQILNITEAAMEKTFSPAFRGRIGDIVVFRPLPTQPLLEILDLQLELFNNTLSHKRGITLYVNRNVKQFILDKSIHRPEVGARLIKHKLKSLLKLPFGRELIKRPGFKGQVKATLVNNDITFSFKKAP